MPPNDDITRDIGTAEIGGLDVTSELLKNGWAKVKDLKREPTDDDTRKRELEAEAKAAGLGIWNSHGPQVRFRYLGRLVFTNNIWHVPRLVSCITRCPKTLRHSFQNGRGNQSMARFRNTVLWSWTDRVDVALVEQVRDGSTLRVRLFMPNGEHQLINIALAGVRCARASSKPDESSEPWAEEVRSPV